MKTPLWIDLRMLGTEFYQAAAGILHDPSIKPFDGQAIARGGGITDDSPSIAPHSLAIDKNARSASLQGEEISSDSPSIAPDVALIYSTLQQPSLQSEKFSSGGPSVAKRLFRTGAYGVIFTVIFGTGFAWQASDDSTKAVVKGWANSVVWTSSLLSNNFPPKTDATEAASTVSDQSPTGTAIIPTLASSSQPASTSTAIDSSADLQRQLDAILSDIAIVRRTVEQVAARQDQMVRDIATLQADEQNLRQKASTSSTVFHHLRRAAQHAPIPLHQ